MDLCAVDNVLVVSVVAQLSPTTSLRRIDPLKSDPSAEHQPWTNSTLASHPQSPSHPQRYTPAGPAAPRQCIPQQKPFIGGVADMSFANLDIRSVQGKKEDFDKASTKAGELTFGREPPSIPDSS